LTKLLKSLGKPWFLSKPFGGDRALRLESKNASTSDVQDEYELFSRHFEARFSSAQGEDRLVGIDGGGEAAIDGLADVELLWQDVVAAEPNETAAAQSNAASLRTWERDRCFAWIVAVIQDSWARRFARSRDCMESKTAYRSVNEMTNRIAGSSGNEPIVLGVILKASHRHRDSVRSPACQAFASVEYSRHNVEIVFIVARRDHGDNHLPARDIRNSISLTMPGSHRIIRR
jgi:hypothetical protein